MYKIIRQSEGVVRQITENKLANNLISKDVSPNISLATTKATDYYEKETTSYDRIYYVLNGKLGLTIDSQAHELMKGDACYISKNTEYEMRGSFEAIVVNQPAFGSRQVVQEKESQEQLSARLAEATQKVTVGARYRHYKQQSYKVLNLAIREEDGEPVVVYQAEYGDQLIFTRLVSSWIEEVETNDGKVKRFAKIEDDQSGDSAKIG